MHNAIITLRLVAAERRFDGSPTSRENAIRVFLAELNGVLAEPVIEGLSKETLGDIYEDWLRHGLDHSQAQRLAILRRAVSITRAPFSVYADRTEPEPSNSDNVVTLHARHG